MFNRSGGVLLHISSLMGPYGIGVFGKDALRFIDFLKQAGFRAWQVLPFAVPDHCNSPYKSVSAFAGNPLFIDPEQLLEMGLITQTELEGCKAAQPYTVDFDLIKGQRDALFNAAFARCDIELKTRIDAWASNQPWIEDYALYTALQQESGKDWIEWELPLKLRQPQAIEEAKERLKPAIDRAIFLQYLFFTQWQAIRNYANEKGIEIIGDMPIYVSHESADVWSHQHLFALDADGYAQEEAGVPPDYFSEDGQRWGNPLYDWSAMKADGYRWWIERLQTAGTLFDRIRIDHFRAFSAYWAVPATAETAKEGQWKAGPGMDFFNVIFQKIDKELLIAEDLGVQDDALRTLLKETGLPGMRVLQFAFPGMDNGIHLPHNYSANTVAYTGTHDNNTLLGYLWELTPEDRRYALDYCGFYGEEWKEGGAKNPAIFALIRTLWASHAALAMVPIQDLLGFGGDTKMNHPGIAKGNWGYRLTEEAFAQLEPDEYRKLSSIYNRV